MLSYDIRRPVAVTMGDPAGVGPEVTARAWAARGENCLPPFVAIGDIAAIEAVWDGPVVRVGDMEEVVKTFGEALPVWHLENSGPLNPGSPTAAGATCALHALETGIGLTRNQASSALVTGSVSKHALHGIGYTHPWQTEFIAERCGVTATNAVMLQYPFRFALPTHDALPFMYKSSAARSGTKSAAKTA